MYFYLDFEDHGKKGHHGKGKKDKKEFKPKKEGKSKHYHDRKASNAKSAPKTSI